MAPKNKKAYSKTAMLSQALADVKMNPALSQQKARPFTTGNVCPAMNPDMINQMASASASNTIDYVEDDDDDSNALDSDEDFDEEACLHCQNTSMQVQVRCDECNSYICNQCHWCHEYQSNHEIRVCDRCDAFYCRACDEMDQCDDCGEVVCGTCSTLLSCKFCGGGLCEDCATACGRCGIVLCKSDAKFAVECDTCRLSYCLVCLASGNKDPCVRCGHRPSKRMEQLVHLRLKSIYKAFKSSTTSLAPPGSSFNNDGSASLPVGPMPGPSKNLKIRENDDPALAAAVDDLGPSALMLAAAASATTSTSQLAAAAAACDLAASLAPPNSQLAAAAQAAAALGVNPATVASDFSAIAAASVVEEDYEKERMKAEKAAAELLAELDEEEQAVKTKKSKKKKKKERQQAKKAVQVKKEEQEAEHFNAFTKDDTKTAQKNCSNKQVKSEKKSEILESSVADQSAQKRGTESKATNSNQSESATHTTITAFTALSSKVDESNAIDEGQKSEEPVADPQEDHFKELMDSEDIDGLEELLSSIKGVPGKAVLRKNVKKALKRFRVLSTVQPTTEGVQEAATPALPPTQLVSATSTPFQSPKVEDLLTIVSLTHDKMSSTRSPKGHPVTPKSECILHMHHTIVGWVIGKGGQRIRDLMEDSGARIWIDQESIGPQEPRVVYVSGQRSSVESAVRMITDLIAKAPPETPNSRSKAPIQASTIDQQPGPAGLPSLAIPKIPASGGLSMNRTDQSSAPFMLKPREAVKNTELSAKREMSCDPRFVPLLIGRRGWTIKNIQDNSGARVDIDQNVIPRKITISGNATAVEVASRMVGEVLSYPQSLLHGTEEADIEAVMRVFPGGVSATDEGLFGVNVEGPKDHLPSVDKQPYIRASSPDEGEVGKTHSHSSPPSSLIVTGDGKSTISSTSSLSSTPEPSASTNKANQQNLPSAAPLLPLPAYDQQRLAQNSNAFGSFPQVAASNQNLLQGGLSNQNNTIGVGLGSRNIHQHFESLPHGISHQPLGAAMDAVGPGSSLLRPDNHSFAQPPIPGQPFAVASQGGSQPFSSMQQQSPFNPGMPPSPISHGTPAQMGNPSSAGMTHQHQHQHQQFGSPQAASLWNEPPEASEGYRLQEAVNFLQHNEKSNSIHPLGQTRRQQDATLSGIMGLSGQANGISSLGLDQTLPPTSSKLSMLPSSNTDDAKVVETLFGSTTQNPRNDSIVPGLQGLSLDPAPRSSEDPWAGSNSADLKFSQASGGPVEASSLFATEADNDRRHSRFSWGESG